MTQTLKPTSNGGDGDGDPLAALLAAAGCSQYLPSLREMEFDVEAVRLADVVDLQECGIAHADCERIMMAAAEL